jgi:hypothetical protein
MRRLIIFLLITGLYNSISAQKLGYIRNDTAYISGDIFMQNGKRSATTCKFRLYSESPIMTYSPDQILAYGCDKKDYYSFSVKSGNDSVKRFLLAIVQGDSPVYYLKDKSGKHFFILKKKELVELVKKKGEYKKQLAEYFDISPAVTSHVHNRFSKQGIKQTIKFMKSVEVEIISGKPDGKGESHQKVVIKKKSTKIAVAFPNVTFQAGVTWQKLPLDLGVNLPSEWNTVEAQSITYSLAANVPVLANRPFYYRQEINFNKFVTNYTQGANPPDYQLIQDYAVLSLPAMLGYAVYGKKLTFTISAGVQFDISLNKNNIGWLKTGEGGNILSGNEVETGYLTYASFRPGITAGLGLNYKINKQFAAVCEARYSRISGLLPDYAGIESQLVIKAGISYYLGK